MRCPEALYGYSIYPILGRYSPRWGCELDTFLHEEGRMTTRELSTGSMRCTLGGPMGDYMRAVTQQWLLVAPRANPAMLDMFRDRDRRPHRNMVPWAGEFAGKYLTSAVQLLRLTEDANLRTCVEEFVADLLACQAEDGYLGPWPARYRLRGTAPNVGGNGGPTWDAWGHYHIALGLLLWNEYSGDGAALRGAERIADLFCKKFLGRKRPRLVDTGSTEMNLAMAHALCLLYRRNGARRYLELTLQIVEEFAATDGEGNLLAGDYVNQALRGVDFFQTPKPRWESLHPIMALAELYWITGEEHYRRVCEQIWWSIARLDRHNNGGFSSGEQAQGNPYHQGAIETCCTIAWMAFSIEVLKMTGDSVVADELELSLLNSGLGLHSPSGRWVTYNTPMDGVRRASAHDIVFQAREGSPELNCCSVNGPRGLGLLGDWALLSDGENAVLNWYGPAAMEIVLRCGVKVHLRQETDYPHSGRIRLHVAPRRAHAFALKLRVPHWSARTRVRINGTSMRGVIAGEYLTIERRWKEGDCVEIDLDMSLHYWLGQRECRGKASLYRGPVLLTYDRRFNEIDPQHIPALDMDGVRMRLKRVAGVLVAVNVKAADGRALTLCDFASAGAGGAPYRSWLKVRGGRSTPFSPRTPLRSGRISS